MVQPTRAKFLRTLKITILAAGLPLILCQSGWTQSPTPAPIDSSIKSYIKQLTDGDSGNDESAVKAVKQMGRTAVDPLVKELQNDQAEVRSRVAALLGEIGSEAKNSVKPLVSALQNDKEIQVRREAAQALGEIGSQAEDAIPPLIASLEKDEDQSVRVYAGLALAKISPTDPNVLKAWSNALKESDLNVQKMAAYNLANSLGSESSKNLIPFLSDIRSTLRSDGRWQVKLVSAIVLGGSIQDIKTALLKLNELLQDQSREVRRQAIEGLSYVGDQLRRQAENLNLSEIAEAQGGLNQSIDILNTLRHNLEVSSINTKEDVEKIDRLIISLRGTIEVLNAIKTKYFLEQSIQWLKQNWLSSWPFIPLFYIILILSLWSILLWLRPLWLRKISEKLLQIEKIPLPKWTLLPTLPHKASLIAFFQYHPRVLDAWVEANLAIVQCAFANQTTVNERSIHIPLPVVLNDRDIPYLTNQYLQPEFAEKLVRILIWGEGGSGKTSLACELARWAMSNNPQKRLCQHRMLPILLEVAQELDCLAESEKSLVEIVRGRLRELLNIREPISAEFSEQLLKQQRLLVIVDGLSEMGKMTRRLIHPEHPNFPINALLVTSRIKEQLGGVNHTILQPMKVSGNHLSEFMGSYLTSQGKRELFTDQEFFEACSRLAAIAGNRDITVLLAKLYAEQMIAVKVGTMVDDIPDNIPALMLKYLKQLNQSVAENQLNNRTIQHDAKIIAWECLKRTYQPTTAKRNVVLTVLGYEDAEYHLDYFENRLRVIQTSGISEDYIRFALDPLAEYLASLYLVERYENNEQAWREFLAGLDAQGLSEHIQGFLLALKDCCLANKEMLQLPDFLIEKLNQWTISEQNSPTIST